MASLQPSDHPRIAQALADLLYMMAGVFACGFALRGFIVPSHFFDGGTTGVSLVVQATTGVDIGYLVLPLTLPFMVLGWRLVNGAFAVKTLGCIFGLSYCLLLVPYPVITADKLLVAVFGGMFMGLGNGLAARGGAALDGMDVVALYTGKWLPFTSSEISFGLNVLIFTFAALTVGPKFALYSMLISFVGARTSAFVVEGIEAYTRVTIVSGESEAVKRMLVEELGRGITVYKGERGFLPGAFDTSQPVDIVTTIVTRLEVPRLRERVREIDATAFIVTADAKDATGGILRRRSSGG